MLALHLRASTSELMELVCIDFWSAEVSDGKSMNVLVTDHFSKMAHAFPCKNQSAKQVARNLWDDVTDNTIPPRGQWCG